MKTLETNINKVTDFITNKIGWTVNNKETAIELLGKYPYESENKNVKSLIANNGVCNGKLIFFK